MGNSLRQMILDVPYLSRAGPCLLLQGASRITRLKTAGDIRLGDHHSCGLYAKDSSFDTTTRKHCKSDAFLTLYSFHLLFLRVWNLSCLLKERAPTAGARKKHIRGEVALVFAMQTFWVSTCKAPLLLDLCIKWTLVVNFALRPFDPRKIHPLPIG